MLNADDADGDEKQTDNCGAGKPAESNAYA